MRFRKRQGIRRSRTADASSGQRAVSKALGISPSSPTGPDGETRYSMRDSLPNCHIKDGGATARKAPRQRHSNVSARIHSGTEDAGNIKRSEGYLPPFRTDLLATTMQEFAVSGHNAEYRLPSLSIRVSRDAVGRSDGYRCGTRLYRGGFWAMGPLHSRPMLSPRVTPQMIGPWVFLKRSPAGDILDVGRPYDADRDGISPRQHWSGRKNTNCHAGRLAKAGKCPRSASKSSRRLCRDIGISNPIFGDPFGRCSAIQDACVNAPPRAGECAGSILNAKAADLVTFYSRNLAVPARRDVD